MTPYEIANEFGRYEVAALLQSYGLQFKDDLGSNIAEAVQGGNAEASREELNVFCSKYSQEHANLELVLEVIRFSLGYSEPGTILVILPGYSEVIDLRDMISASGSNMKDKAEILTLHSHLPLPDYKRLFAKVLDSKRKVILATGAMIESAVSFDDISCVIDSGLIRDRENDSITISPRKTCPISKVSRLSQLKRHVL